MTGEVPVHLSDQAQMESRDLFEFLVEGELNLRREHGERATEAEMTVQLIAAFRMQQFLGMDPEQMFGLYALALSYAVKKEADLREGSQGS